MPAVTLHELIGQPEAAAFLRGVVARGRFANAYLFHGPQGVGLGTAAIALARAILCEHPPKASPDDACGTCATCAKTADLQHPDLKFLFPVSGEERELDETVAATYEAWRRDPLHVFQYEKAASIRLSLTRDLLRELAYKPFEAARRVVVVRDADRMREDQYSALLKAIEEPGAATVWVLTTARPTRLPATILSRCQRVRFRALSEATVAEFLVERAQVQPRQARILAALSGGSLGRSLVLKELDPIAVRDQAIAMFTPALGRDPHGVFRAIQGFNRFGRAGRETLRRTVEMQQLWLRDILRVRYGAPREQLVNRDKHAELERQAATVDATEVRRRLMVLEDALKSIEGNVTPDLALFSALSRVGDPGLETGEWPEHGTGRWR